MDLIVEIRFGAHLYGTDTPDSDLDLKGVYLPEPRDILLQRVKSSVTLTPAKARGEKITVGDVDREAYSLQRYSDFSAKARRWPSTCCSRRRRDDHAAPPAVAPDPGAGEAACPRRLPAFVRYCQQQANKYGIKGSRVATARQAMASLSAAEATTRNAGRSSSSFGLAGELACLEHVAFADVSMPGGRFDLPSRDLRPQRPFHRLAQDRARNCQRIVEEFGQRALQAERNEGVDWKALSHAVRVGREAHRALRDRPHHVSPALADHIRRIKGGEIAYETVANEIEDLLVTVVAGRSPVEPAGDTRPCRIDELVALAYRRKIMESD